MFLLRLATEVDFSAQEPVFMQQVAEELSFYYARFVDLLTLQAQAINYGEAAPKQEESKSVHD